MGGRQGSAVPSPRPSGDAPALPAFAPLLRQRFSNRTFLSEAAVPHHANAVTKRRRYYGKDFSASYSQVRDSAAGRSRLLTGEFAGNQPLPQHPTWPEPGGRQRPAERRSEPPQGHRGSLSWQTPLLVFREDDMRSRQQILAMARERYVQATTSPLIMPTALAASCSPAPSTLPSKGVPFCPASLSSHRATTSDMGS